MSRRKRNARIFRVETEGIFKKVLNLHPLLRSEDKKALTLYFIRAHRTRWVLKYGKYREFRPTKFFPPRFRRFRRIRTSRIIPCSGGQSRPEIFQARRKGKSDCSRKGTISIVFLFFESEEKNVYPTISCRPTLGSRLYQPARYVHRKGTSSNPGAGC